MKFLQRCAVAVLMMFSASMVYANDAISNDEKTAAVEQPEPKKSRLKFKSRGPTCLCADGLTEADIVAQQKAASDKK